jgi:hypothetical protein
MTATTLTHIAAAEHVNDLRREAERQRRAAEVPTPSRDSRSIPRWLARRVLRSATA